MLACDFFHVDCAVTLQRTCVFFAIEIGSHYIHILDVTTNPDRPRTTTQQAPTLLADLADRAGRFQLRTDRAGQFTSSFDAVLTDAWYPRREDPTRMSTSELLRRTIPTNRHSRTH